MPRVRHGGASDPSFQWQSESSVPSQVQWTPRYSDVLPDPPKGVPDVPLNVDHRYCTPPPVDPRYMDEHVGPKDDFPPHLGRAPSPDDFDELTGARAPLAPPGSIHNPVVIEDDENARRYRASLPLGPPPGLENSPRRSTRTSHRAANNGQSRASTSNNQSQAPTNNILTAAGSSSSRKSSRNARAGLSVAADPPVVQSRYRKTAVDGFTPKMSSPLKRVAFKESTDMLVVPNTPGRWDIPPRKHSTSSVTVNSVDSSDSEYE